MWFFPNSALTEQQMRTMPTEVATRMPEAYFRVIKELSKTCIDNPVDVEKLLLNEQVRNTSEIIGELFEKYGSDKSTVHNYQIVYAAIMCTFNMPVKILEIGLGSNNTLIASNMGPEGKPGASLRAFKEFLPESRITGADIDKTIKVEDCTVFFVDQTNPETFEDISRNGDLLYDLIIDDGLHSPDANLNTILFGLKHISQNGYIVIEDIPESALPIWKSLQYSFLQTNYTSKIIKTRSAYMFIVTQNQSFFGI